MKIALGEKVYMIKGTEIHTEFGVIPAKNGKVKTSTGKEFTVAEPMFIDIWKKMKRKAQIPLLKDVGAIVAYTGVGHSSTIIDAGAGSGGIALFLAHLVKHVYTYDMREDHCDVVRKNMETLGLSNVTVTCADIRSGVNEKDVDLFTLDVPEPWTCLEAVKAARLGGYVVSYSPNLTQVQQFVLAVNSCSWLQVEKSVELVEREWKVTDRVLKPFMGPHSGFLTFCRRI